MQKKSEERTFYKPFYYNILNAIMFYIGWLFCVTSAANGKPTAGLLAACVITAFHLLIIKRKLKELLLISISVIIGFCLETIMIRFRILQFTSPNATFPGYAPFWILGLYALFATTLNHSLGWLRRFYLTAACIGSFGAMLSYTAGEYLGAVEFIIPQGGSIIAIGFFWFMLTPALYILNELLEEYA